MLLSSLSASASAIDCPNLNAAITYTNDNSELTHIACFENKKEAHLSLKDYFSIAVHEKRSVSLPTLRMANAINPGIKVFSKNKTFERELLKKFIANGFSIVDKLEIDITNNGLKDIVWSVESNKTGNAENYLYIFTQTTSGKYKLFFSKKNLLPTYQVVGGALASYNLEKKGNTLTIALTSPVKNTKDVYFFEFGFKYQKTTRSFKLVDSLYREWNSCDHEDLGKYRINSSHTTNKFLAEFNGNEMFESIYNQWQSSDSKIMRKIKTKQLLNKYDTALNLFKKRNLDKLKIYVDDYFIRYTDEKCTPESYMDEYVFLDTKADVGMTNDIAFFFEQTGHYDESIFLLEKVIEAFPNRAVAYVNLGDAKWGLNEKKESRKAYDRYVKLMTKNGKKDKIPKRVLSRITQY